MPMMQDLIAQLNEAPPQSEGELRELLAGTGYDLIMTEPSMEGDDDGEYMEDMGPEEEPDVDMEDEESMEMPADPMSLMAGMMPPAMEEGNDLSQKGRGKMRIQVAKFALKDDKNKRGESYE